jgi:DNA-directed RNA polymerase specialized sigma24 family protein
MAATQLTITTAQGDEVLKKLILDAQETTSSNPNYHLAIQAIASLLLRGRQICRPLPGNPLLPVQEEIFGEIRLILEEKLQNHLPSYNQSGLALEEWAKGVKKSVWQESLKDENLKKLALAAQAQENHTPLRQHLLRELIASIRLSGRLCRPHRQKFQADFYELLYEEAVNETLLYVCQNLDKYDPERGKDKKFMTWVNFRLDKSLLDCHRRFSHLEGKGLIRPDFTLQEMEQIEQPQVYPSLGECLQDYLEADPDNLFRQAQIRNQPQANFHAIALARLAGRSWEEISQEFHLAVPTLSSFYQRCCRKFAQHFQQHIET